MSSTAASDRHDTSSNKSGSIINAGIDSSFASDPAHRGSLTPPELDSIHQTNSFKQASQLENEDNRDLATKMKILQRSKEPTKQ